MRTLRRNTIPLDLLNATRERCETVVERSENNAKKAKVYTIDNLFDAQDEIFIESDSRVGGDEIKAELRAALRYLTTMTGHQEQFVEVFITCLLPFIYGAEFDENEARLKREHNIDEILPFAFVCCPRRWGKSRIMAWFTACGLLTIPLFIATIFSPGKRQSGFLMEQIRKDLAYLNKVYPGRIKRLKGKENKETFGIEVKGTERQVRGLPAKENTVRGVDGNFIVCEEAAAMPVNFFTKVITPVAGPRTTAMVCISTISGAGEMRENWFTTLLNMRKPNGKSVFNTFKVILACDKCIEDGIADTCKHRLSDIPHWHSEMKQMMMRAIFDQLGEREQMLQETVGLSQTEAIPAFEKQQVYKCFSLAANPHVTDEYIDEKPRAVYVTVDPSGGGLKSNIAVISTIHHRRELIVVGIEDMPGKLAIREAFIPFVLKHVEELLKIPFLDEAKVVFSIESNMGPQQTVPVCEDLLKTFPGRVVIMRKERYTTSQTKLHNATRTSRAEFDTIGKHTSGHIKMLGMKMYREYMAQRAIRFYKHGISIYNNNPQQADFKPYKDNLEKLKKQNLNFLLMQRQPTDENVAFGEFVITASGKNSGHDDLISTILNNLFFSTQFRENTNFSELGIL